MLKRSKSGGGTVKVTFALAQDEPSGAVSVLGDFNEWNELSHPLKKRSNGTRSVVIEMRAGRDYHFKYLAEDGTWFNEDDADLFATNEYGEVNSVLRL
jgi:1,4-alpha-glucan branching enzyme